MQDLEEEVRRLRFKVKYNEGNLEDRSGIYPRSDVVINGVEKVEEGVALIDPSLT